MQNSLQNFFQFVSTHLPVGQAVDLKDPIYLSEVQDISLTDSSLTKVACASVRENSAVLSQSPADIEYDEFQILPYKSQYRCK